MTTATTTMITTKTAARAPMLARIHIARRDLGLDEETYRAVLSRIGGRPSARDLDTRALAAVLAEFRRLGWRPKAPPSAEPPRVAKARALWRAGYHLGVVRDPSDAALRAFVKRQAGLDSERWLTGAAEARRVVEALKSWLSREAGVRWQPGDPRARVLEAQWRLLAGPTASLDGEETLGGWLDRYFDRGGPAWAFHPTAERADAAIAALGARIRANKGRQS